MMTERSSFVVHLLLLAALCGVLYFPYLGRSPFFDKGEPREGVAVQDIVQRGEWLFPLKRATAIPSKPPLFHWSAALTAQITGTLDEATIRFPSTLYATLGVVAVYLLGRKMYGGEVGLTAGAILATTLIYQNQALSARVDMTLCLFVTLSLIVFYALYRGFLIHPAWHFALYAIVGIGTLAKGPLGILLPALVIAVFLAVKKRWHLIAKFAFHPGVIITLVLAVGWYGLAITRGGEGFVNRQLLQENLERFFGGSGHDGPFYYYISYLFALGLPWSLFLPFVLWDSFKSRVFSDDNELFLWVWFLAMFIFFSVSAGKRSVYLLPIYPALSLLIAAWLHQAKAAIGVRLLLLRAVAIFAAMTGIVLLLIALGDLWGHEPGWFFSPIERLLKAKDRANFELIKNQLADFGWRFDLAALLSAILWCSAAYCLWTNRLLVTAPQLVMIAIVTAFIGRGLVVPEIAEAKSYREFMRQVAERVQPGNRLYLYGGFNSDPVIFYHGGVIHRLDKSVQIVVDNAAKSNTYIIMDELTWNRIRQVKPDLPAPLLKSQGKGAEGDAPLVLVPATVS
jgi:4-amino-4-deoxy-L-arabinose transferase-like glycosyltransferase